MANPYLEGVDSASTTPDNPYLEGVESTSNPYLSGVEATNSTPKTNWAGTGPTMSFSEYMKSGFGGRFVTSAIRGDSELMMQADATAKEQLGPNYKQDPMKFQQVFTDEYRKLVSERDAAIQEERKKNPQPTLSQSIEEFGKQLISNPWDTAKSMVYELGKDPELLLLGPVLGGAKTATAATAVGRAAKAGKVATDIAKSGAKAAATGAVLETAASAGEPGGVDLQKVVNTAGNFAVLGATLHAGAKGYKSIFGKEVPKTEGKTDFENLNDALNTVEADLNKTEEATQTATYGETMGPLDKEAVLKTLSQTELLDPDVQDFIDLSDKVERAEKISDPDTWTEQQQEAYKAGNWKEFSRLRGYTESEIADYEQYLNLSKTLQNRYGKTNPDYVAALDHLVSSSKLPLEAIELEKSPELKVAGDVFKSLEGDTPTEAVMRTLREINVNNRLSTLWRRSIEKLIPEASVRERTTMALEGERSYDKLLTDEEKRQTLYGDSEAVKAEKEAKGIRPEIGLTGVLNLYEAAANRLGIGGRTDAALPDGAFKTFWDNYKLRNGLNNRPVTEQVQHLAEKLGKLRYAVDKLERLPSEEHAIPVMREIQGKLAEIGKVAQQQGLMEHLRHNYISHVLNFSESALSDGQRRTLVDALFSDKKSRFNRDFTQHRVYNTIRELEAAVYDAGKKLGIDTRGVKVERDVAKIAEIYQKSMMNANLIKRLVNYLEKSTTKNLMGDDIPLLTKDPQVAFRHKYQFFEGRGSEGLEGYAVHPDIVDLMKFIANQTDPNVLLKAAGQVSMLAKYLNTMGSLFHATSLFVARTTSTPGVMLKEIFTGGRGTRLALEELENNGASESVKMAQRDGLQVGLPEDAARTVLTDISNTVDKIVSKSVGKEDLKVTRKVVDPLEEKLLKNMNRFTWDYMHAAGKLHLYQTWVSKISAKNPDIPIETISKEVASYVNNTLGGLDWLKVAQESNNKFVRDLAMKALNPQGRQWLQVLLFAPDWTISTIRSMSKALPRELLKPQNWQLREGIKGFKNPKLESDLARRYVFNTTLMWLTILNGFNYAFSGHFIWQNKDKTRVDLGDGTTMQMAKHSMESAEWVQNFGKTASNKLAVLPKTALTAYLASQGMARDVKTPFGKIEGNSLFGIAAASGESMVPFQINAALDAPTGEKTKRALASFLGIPIYGQTDKLNTPLEVLMERKAQRKESRRENKLQKMEDR